MSSNPMSTLLNPVRLQILKTLLVIEKATPKEMGDQLKDVPTTTLYRHLNTMIEEGVLEIVSEKQKRGTMERTYRIRKNPLPSLRLHADEMSASELLELFYSFSISQMMDFSQMLGKENPKVESDHIGFSTYLLHLNDEELKNFKSDLGNILKVYGVKTEHEGSRIHKFSLTFLPEQGSK
ncbi:MAG: helix-turn-helix domain-containing protein [Candidatus Izemoplasmatales bacterium]|nr:helix-turn-helix domain-containing protein [Candidatus Izemoplasmatales bacterium]